MQTKKKKKITKTFFHLFNLVHLYLIKEAPLTLSVTSYDFLSYFL